ncbi:hypothetical protein LOTGIDRAFT_161143 [Lottia gigantea]|uniref:Uncharacterized protein n=1 Tax=Lottia gigantea TaxID=225164 RepID=V3ZSN1_LOTGI|nr:hypothetical protein LOTGIDRAFT_161143 [Lottia gigantea]ESO94453.1 hypothetical protein LOTGIDRAFT_161143 [Lottia gigantea]
MGFTPGQSSGERRRNGDISRVASCLGDRQSHAARPGESLIEGSCMDARQREADCPDNRSTEGTRPDNISRQAARPGDISMNVRTDSKGVLMTWKNTSLSHMFISISLLAKLEENYQQNSNE